MLERGQPQGLEEAVDACHVIVEGALQPRGEATFSRIVSSSIRPRFWGTTATSRQGGWPSAEPGGRATVPRSARSQPAMRLRSGLPGPGSTDEPDHLAPGRFEGHVVDRVDDVAASAERLDEVPDLQPDLPDRRRIARRIDDRSPDRQADVSRRRPRRGPGEPPHRRSR